MLVIDISVLSCACCLVSLVSILTTAVSTTMMEYDDVSIVTVNWQVSLETDPDELMMNTCWDDKLTWSHS